MEPYRNGSTRARLEIDLLRRSLGQRLDKLEANARPPEAPKRGLARFLGWMGPALPQLIGSAVMLGLAFMVKDSVDLAIRQQQLQLSYVQQMKAELVEMAKDGASVDDVERSAMLLSAFGKPAAMPLINELRYGGNRAVGAESGLRALAFSEPETVCKLLLRAIDSRAAVFDAEGHGAAVRVLVAGQCTAALPLLRQQHQAVIALERMPADAREAGFLRTAPTNPQLKELKQEIAHAIAQLEALKPRWSWS